MEARRLLATITVTGTGDTIATDGIVTLREAITAANTNAASGDAPAGGAGQDTIAFNIPGARVHTIAPTSALPSILEPLIVDGYSQPGSSPNSNGPDLGDNAVLRIELDGSNAGIRVNGLEFLLFFNTESSAVRGLAINRFSQDGVAIGGRSNSVLVQGNFIGTDAGGTLARGNLGVGVVADGQRITIGGTDPALRNLISGNGAQGISLGSSSSQDNLVQGNFIGTDVTGAVALGNLKGIVMGSSSNNTIGGLTAAARNLISGNVFDGVTNEDGGQGTGGGNVVQGNFIGTQLDGVTPLGNGRNGVATLLAGRGPTFIGGTTAGAGNVIAHNGGFGVLLDRSSRVSVLGNSIVANGDRGIESTFAPDSPVLTSFPDAGGGTAIQGTLKGTPNATFRLEFFSSVAPDPSSFGEGQAFLGFKDVTTDGSGNATFTATTAADGLLPLPAGQSFVTSTATGPDGSTSEFSQLVANLALAEAGPPASAAVGQDVVFTATVTNAGPFPAAGATLTDTLPPNTTFVSATGGGTPVNGVLTVPLGTLLVGSTTTVTIVLRATATGTVDNPIRLASLVTDPDMTDNSATATANIDAAASADLSVAVSGAPDPATIGQDLAYTVTVTNGGPSSTAATLTDTLPSGVTFVSATGGVTPTAGVLTFDLGTLAAGGRATVTIVVRPTAAGTLTDLATVAGTVPDPAPANNSASRATAVDAPTRLPDLALFLTDAPDPATVGQELSYTITVTNAGPVTATAVLLTDTLPAGVDFVRATGGVAPAGRLLTFPLGTLAPSAHAAVTIVVRPGRAGTLTDTARVEAGEAESDTSNNSATQATAVRAAAPPTADLAVAIATSPGRVTAGRELTYTVTVTNRGTGVATGATLADTLPQGTTLVSASRGTFDARAGRVTALLGTLPVGGSAKVTVVVRTRAGARQAIVNTADVTADQVDPDPANNRARAATNPVVPPAVIADLSVAAAATRTAILGSNLALTFAVTNRGPDQAAGVRLVVALPHGAALVSAGGGARSSGGRLTFDLGTLAAGTRAGVVVVIRPTAAGSVTTMATATAATSDPSAANNTTRATALIVERRPDVRPAVVGGPKVVALQRYGFHAQPTWFVARFDKGLDPKRAIDSSNYILIAPGRDGWLGTPDDRVVPIVSASYAPAARAVLLQPAERLDIHVPYRIKIVGTGPRGIADVGGNLLDGDGDERPGGDFVAIVTRSLLAGRANALGPIFGSSPP